MLYRLCLAIGFPHPDYLLQALTVRQIEGWTNYAAIEPFGSPADDARAAVMTWAPFQSRSKKKIDPARFSIEWENDAAPLDYKSKAQGVYARATAALKDKP